MCTGTRASDASTSLASCLMFEILKLAQFYSDLPCWCPMKYYFRGKAEKSRELDDWSGHWGGRPISSEASLDAKSNQNGSCLP